MAFTLDLTGLADYIDTNRDEIISKVSVPINSTKYMNVQTNVKADRELHTLITDLTVQDGTDCGFNPAGEQTLSGRLLEPAFLKTNVSYCPKSFYGTWQAYATKVAMGKSPLPLEQQLVDDIIKSIQVSNEKAIWSGAEATDFIDGFTTLWAADNGVNTYSTTETSVLKRCQAMYERVDMKDYVLAMSLPMYRKLVNELINTNFFITVTDDENNAEKILTLPGTDLRIHGIEGIASDDTNIYAFKWSDLFLGVDLADDASQFDLFWSADDRVYKLVVEWVLAVQYAFSDRIYIDSYTEPEPDPEP